MQKFTIGISGDLLNKNGLPCFGETPLKKLYSRNDVELIWMPKDIDQISQDMSAKYDAILLNLPKATAESVERDDCKLKIISRFGVGYDSVDIKAMKEKNIIVTNTPNAVRRPVAIAAMTMIFSLSGRIFEKDDLVRTGRWNERTDYMGLGLTKKVLGILGAGNIGTELIALTKPFFKKIISYDPNLSDETIRRKGAKKVDFFNLAEESDFIVLLCNLNNHTRGLINLDFFKKMKNSSYLINMSRGPVINEKDLIFSLDNNLIKGAGLDVMDEEPVNMKNKILSFKNTILSPHALCWTDECFEDIANEAIDSIINFIENKNIINKVV